MTARRHVPISIRGDHAGLASRGQALASGSSPITPPSVTQAGAYETTRLAMALSPGARLGPDEVFAPIGAGGMGEVYRARDTRLNRDVAIKVLPDDVATSPDRLARFEREAKAVAGLSHPNIVALYPAPAVSPDGKASAFWARNNEPRKVGGAARI